MLIIGQVYEFSPSYGNIHLLAISATICMNFLGGCAVVVFATFKGIKLASNLVSEKLAQKSCIGLMKPEKESTTRQ